MGDEVTKACFKCGRKLPRTEFYAHSKMADGLLGKCKTCTKIDVKGRTPEERACARARDKARASKPRRKAWRHLHPGNSLKKRVRSLTRSAIIRGRLVSQPCEKCGEAKVEAHHDDYEKPLDVRWLCFKHHREHHGQKVH